MHTASREERTIEPAQKKARVLRVSQKLLNENWLRQFFLAIDFVYQELNTYQFESKIAYGCSEKVQQRNNIEWNPVSFCLLHLIGYQILLSIYESEADIPEHSLRGFIWKLQFLLNELILH